MEQTIENQIQDLEQQLQAKREQLSQQGGEELPSDRDILHEIVGEQIGELPPLGSSATQQASDDDQATGQTPAPLPPANAQTPSYLTPELQEEVQKFTNMAFEKNLESAVSAVRATGNAALIDAFHDAIVDELYKHLLERGKLKEI